MLVASAPVSSSAQQQDHPNDQVIVTGSPPVDVSGLTAGPEIKGFISARSGDKMQVTSADGTSTMIVISDGTKIKSSGGFLGIKSDKIAADSLLNGVPVAVKTVQWNNGLLASQVDLKSKDLKTAEMIWSGTSQRFAQQGAAINKNAAATEALRGRLADIDKYNIKGTTSVYFDTGKWELSAKAQTDLCAAATQAEGMESALLLVVGYTDSVGSQESDAKRDASRSRRQLSSATMRLEALAHAHPHRDGRSRPLGEQ